jgi:hypothetical protein
MCSSNHLSHEDKYEMYNNQKLKKHESHTRDVVSGYGKKELFSSARRLLPVFKKFNFKWTISLPKGCSNSRIS